MRLNSFGWAWNLGISGRSFFRIFEILRLWYILENQYLAIPLKTATPTHAPDHPLGGHEWTLLFFGGVGRRAFPCPFWGAELSLCPCVNDV